MGRDLGSPIPITEACRDGSSLEGQGSYSTSPVELQRGIAFFSVGCEILETCCLLNREAGS